MNKKNKEGLFSDKRWNEPPGYEAVGHIEFTEEKKEKNREELKKILREKGIIENP